MVVVEEENEYSSQQSNVGPRFHALATTLRPTYAWLLTKKHARLSSRTATFSFRPSKRRGRPRPLAKSMDPPVRCLPHQTYAQQPSYGLGPASQLSCSGA